MAIPAIYFFAPSPFGRSWIILQDRAPGSDYVLSDVPHATSPRHLDITLLLSYLCNLACIYCYEAHCNEGILPFPTACEITADLIERHAGDTDTITIGYFGGEPTLWTDFMLEFTAWIRRIYPQKRIMIGMTSNGVMSSYALRHVWQCVDRVKISVDGTKDLQDFHRPLKGGGARFERAFFVLTELYRQRPRDLTLRTTVTHHSVARMPEICEFFCRHFPGVRQQYEPVMDSCFADHAVATVNMAAFVDSYLAAYDIAQRHETKIGTSFARFSPFLDAIDRFCGVASLKYTVLPDGSIASCNRVHTSTVRTGPFFLAEPGEHRQISRP